jgi:two-component system, cell cycle response regulator DivK
MTTRVLVVEDNERNLKLVRDVLQFAGFDVLEARTGEQAVDVAVAERPDVVLMDLRLPGIDGDEALRRIRSSAGTVAIPVIALTASVMKEDRARVMTAGFDGYLEKPISVRDLAAQVRTYLRRSDATE